MSNYKRQNDKAAAAHAAGMVDRAVFDALKAVFADGAFCAQAITKALKTVSNERAHAFVTSAFYGVLDNNVRLEKIIAGLCQKTDKTASVVLKMGIYYLKYADMPEYAAVNRVVELSKHVGAYSGFINAVLKRSIGYEPEFVGASDRFAYEHNAPEWFCKALIADYGETRAAAILDAKLPTKTHIRPVAGRITRSEFADIMKGVGELTEYGCYCDKKATERLSEGTYAVQALSSVRAAHAYVSGIDGGTVLDLCAAPGGKSILMSELGKFKVTACDIYPHKIELMRGYAKKLGARISLRLNDATVKNKDFIGAYDIVVADCPCSGSGTFRTKPDVLIKRTPSDLDELTALQYKILDIAADYCKAGGTLCYSTCSVFRRENEEIAQKFLLDHSEYSLLDTVKLLPDTDRCDGFYIVRFRREGAK